MGAAARCVVGQQSMGHCQHWLRGLGAHGSKQSAFPLNAYTPHHSATVRRLPRPTAACESAAIRTPNTLAAEGDATASDTGVAGDGKLGRGDHDSAWRLHGESRCGCARQHNIAGVTKTQRTAIGLHEGRAKMQREACMAPAE